MSKLSRADTAKMLADSHFESEPQIKKIILYSRSAKEQEEHDSEPIKLLEINPDAIGEGIVPVSFGPDASNQVFYRSTIIEVNEGEFEKVTEGKLDLPKGWDQVAKEYNNPAGT